MSINTRSLAYSWALTGIFAAVHLVITLIPFSIGIGGGGEISFGLVSAPIIGFLLGPFFGVIAVIIGSVIAIFINPGIAILGIFTVLATAAGAFAAGLMRTKWRLIVPILFILTMEVFLFSPIGTYVPEFLIFHLVVLLLSVPFFIPKISNKLIEPLKLERKFNRRSGFVAIWLLSIVAVTFDNLVGSAIGAFYFIVAFGFTPFALAEMFKLGIPIIPIERIFGSIVVTFILVGLAEVLVRADFGLPLSRVGNFELLELTEEEI